MIFYVGIHRPNKAFWIDRAFISANRLWDMRAPVLANEWVMDSGAFTEVTTYGDYRFPVEDYADVIRRFARSGDLKAAVAQDYMCEPFVLEKTGLTVADHQRLTIERYDGLVRCDTGGVYIMPVLQGYEPQEYVRHLRAYGDRLGHGSWVGVGSVCKRQGSPTGVLKVLDAILSVRPDLRLHGFGVKLTSLKNPDVCARLYSADSMAWSFAARKAGDNPNDTWTARKYEQKVLSATKETAGEMAAYFGRLNLG
jgi:hypothetical protein